ncbi:GTA baseplate fiber-binding domain-containing protein [Sphingomonas sp. RS2018]
MNGAVLSAPRLTIAAAGTGAGWRQAALSVRMGSGWTGVTTRRLPAVIGRVEAAVPAGSAYLIDRRTTLVVTLAHGGMMLADADTTGIDAGANRALIGDEIVQFERAEPLGGARWRLSGLWRGRRGTEAAAGTAGSGSRFVLLDPGTLHVVDLPESAIGTDVAVMAAGPGDPAAGVTVEATIDGRSVAPPSPVHLRMEAGTLRWVRRGRAGWLWRDGVDVPLTEEREAYRIERGDGTVVSETMAPAVALPADAAGDWSVRQIGTLAPSAAAKLRLF